jgi:hypothetical protein
MGTRLKRFRRWLPVPRKALVTTVVLLSMGAALLFAPRPYGAGLFSLGVLVLASDYAILTMLSLDRQYRWIQARDALTERVERDYRAKVFIERGPDKIELHPQTSGDFRAVVDEASDNLYQGMLFRVYVKAPLDTSDDLSYDLRLGTAEITRVSDTDDESVTAFLTIREWEQTFEDSDEQELAAAAKREIQSPGECSYSPFAKIAERDRINEFETEEWRAIYDWATTDNAVETRS